MVLVNNLMLLPNIPVTMQPYFALFEVANLSGDPRRKAAKRAGEKEGGRGPLFFCDGVVVGGGSWGKVDRAEGSSGLDQLHQFGVAAEKPLRTEGARESRLEGERRSGGVEVEDGTGGR
jgi:hypothetical protein